MTAVIIAFVGKWAGWAVGGLVAVLAVFFTGKRAAQQKAEVKSLRAAIEADNDRKEIDDAINADADLAALANSSGVVRKPKSKR